LPELGDIPIGSENDAGQATGRIVEPLEPDELIEFIGDNVFAVTALAGVVEANEQDLGLDPVEGIHQVGQTKEGERGGFGEEEELGVADDFAGLALADDLNAVGRPISAM
jgi:hypothetical protein